MDVLGVNPMKTQKEFKKNRRNKGVKVVYISSPMKVKTSASKFRALVQELTGRDSDAERFMESVNGKSSPDCVLNRDVGGDENQERVIMKKRTQLEDSHESGYGYGFGFFDFPTSSLQEFGSASIIFG